MPHWKTMMTQKYAGAWSLKGETTVTIERVVPETLRNKQGSDLKPVLYFRGAKLGIPMNKTNCKTVAAMYGGDTDDWIGKRITLYATSVSFGAEQVEAVRVKPGIPGAKAVEGTISDEDPSPERVAQLEEARASAGVAHDEDGVVLTEQLEASTVDAFLKAFAACTDVNDLTVAHAKMKQSGLTDAQKASMTEQARVRRAQIQDGRA